ncbi:MAG: flagellar biosynthesis protein FlhF [Oscillospiraceae bacterium]|jgi:flagellar biosynthesis protein FlhF|nr:flagellar biosynthesis protein FlhF [Oscillospiraceae bacterium]
MKVKVYRVNDMNQALNAASRELGSDAVMINSRKVRGKGLKGFFTKSVLEVQFAYNPDSLPSVKKQKPIISQEYAYKPSTLNLGGTTIANSDNLEKRMDSFETMLTSFMDKFDLVQRDITYDFPDDVQVLFGRLKEQQVRDELALTLAKQTEQMIRAQPGASATEVMEHLLLEQFGRAEPILHKKFTQSVILVIGPTGVGKTTSIVKLAADFAVKQRKKVGIINTDSYRIGAQEQLQTFADILGVPIQLVYYPDELKEAMEQMSDRDMIFVDTAGKGPGDEKHIEDLMSMIKLLEPDDTLLCLAATTSFSSVREMVDTYGFIDNYRVMITKLDETKYRGALLNISWYTHKPFAYVTTGQTVPDDIEVIDVESIVKHIVRG